MGWSVRSKLTTLGVGTYRPSLLRSTVVITDDDGEHCTGVGWSMRAKLTKLDVVTYRPSLLRSTMAITDV